eukprot:11666656-Heterocapsa_arctica.AAC.1
MSAETPGSCKKLLPDLYEIRVDEKSKHTLRGLLQYYEKLDEKANSCKLNVQLKAKIEVNNGLENYSFTTRNTLNEEKLKEKFEGDDKEKVDPLELNQI